jgi:TonB family protein
MVSGAGRDARPVTPAAGFAEAVVALPSAQQGAIPSSAGFGGLQPVAAPPPNRQPISKGQFEAVVVKPVGTASTGKAVASGRFTPLEILDKPRPAYSAEARRLQIEGEVVLEALFSANGRIRVMRVVNSLGHGLDENAIRAAAGIRFRPATEDGSPRDMVAVVRIAFQLAY